MILKRSVGWRSSRNFSRKTPTASKRFNITIYIKRAPEITLQGEVYGPFEEETRELPLAVAMFLLCRKSARVVR